MIEQKDMILDIEVKEHHVTLILTKTTPQKTDIALRLEIDLPMTTIPFLHTILVHDIINIKEILDLHITMTLVTDINLARNLEIPTSADVLPHSHHIRDQEILDTLDLGHPQI